MPSMRKGEIDMQASKAPDVIALLQRLEPRCRDDDFARGLEARTADPLWMLARQSQIGEYHGQNAGSPVHVKISTSSVRIKSVSFGTSVTGTSRPENMLPLEDAPPLEALVEHEYINREQLKGNWRLRVQTGQHLERLIKLSDIVDPKLVICQLRQHYPIRQISDEERIDLDRATQRFLCVMAGRAIDGGALLLDAYRSELGGQPVLPAQVATSLGGDVAKVISAVSRLAIWFKALYGNLADAEPSAGVSAGPTGISRESAWVPERLEYAFRVHAPTRDAEITLVAPSYRSGDLDWFAFSIESPPVTASTSGSRPDKLFLPRPFLPTRVSFYGMPQA